MHLKGKVFIENFYICGHKAQMAELVDALVSGTSVRKDVQVRVLFWAQKGLIEKVEPFLIA